MRAHPSDKGKHLTTEDRNIIEEALNENRTLKSVSEATFKTAKMSSFTKKSLSQSIT